MKPTVQKASLCYKYMGWGPHMCVILFLIRLCFGDEKQGLSISQPMLMQIYLSAPLYQLHKPLNLQQYILKTKQTTHTEQKPHTQNRKPSQL